MLEAFIYIIFSFTLFFPLVFLINGIRDNISKSQKYLLGYHSILFLLWVIFFFALGDNGLTLSQNKEGYVSTILSLRFDKITACMVVLLNLTGLVQAFLLKKSIFKIKDILIYFSFYFLITLGIFSNNILAIVSIEEILLLILALNYKIKMTEAASGTKYYRFANIFLFMSGFLYLIDQAEPGEHSLLKDANYIASGFFCLGIIIKLYLFPFNQHRRMGHIIKLNEGVIEQGFLMVFPVLTILIKLILEKKLDHGFVELLFYLSSISLFLCSMSLMVQENIKNIYRLLQQSIICIFIVHLCTYDISGALYTLSSHLISFLGVITLLALASNKTTSLKDLAGIRLEARYGNVFIYILIGSSIAIPFSPIAFSRYNIIISSMTYDHSILTISIILHLALFVLSLSVFRVFWYVFYSQKLRKDTLDLPPRKIFFLGMISLIIIIFLVMGIPDLFLKDYKLNFETIFNIKFMSSENTSLQYRNLVLMYVFSYSFVALLIMYIFYLKGKKEKSFNKLRYKNTSIYRVVENNFSVVNALEVFLKKATEVLEMVKKDLIIKFFQKAIDSINEVVYLGAGFLTNIRPKGINSNLLLAAIFFAVMLTLLLSKLI